MKNINYVLKPFGIEGLNSNCGNGLIKEKKIINETPNSSNPNDFISIISKNKKVVAVLLAWGLIAAAATTILFSNPFGPPTYSLCRKAGFLRCNLGNQCDTGETLLESGLTLSQCQQKGGT